MAVFDYSDPHEASRIVYMECFRLFSTPDQEFEEVKWANLERTEIEVRMKKLPRRRYYQKAIIRAILHGSDLASVLQIQKVYIKPEWDCICIVVGQK